MWVALRFRSFELEQQAGQPLIKIDAGKKIGYIPVYATLEDAQVDYPDGPWKEIQFRCSL